jgi:hypothetical protein
MMRAKFALAGAVILAVAACSEGAPTGVSASASPATRSSISLSTEAPALTPLTVDQAYDAGFAFGMGINATGGVSQGFTPTVSRLDAVDLFLTGNGNNPAMTLTVHIRSGSFDGPILGTSTVSVPPIIPGSPANPTVLQAEFSPFVPLTPGSLYYIQIDPDGGFLGVAASFNNGYSNGAGYQGDFTLSGLDFGFRTYFSAPPPVPTSKDQCKDGGWATFTAPHAFKNQGDCIQFVNTGK